MTSEELDRALKDLPNIGRRVSTRPGGREVWRFEFGGKQLWVDRVVGMSQAEVWLEIVTDDVPAASAYFKEAGVLRCDEIEPLPETHEGFWIADPASIVLHLGAQHGEWW